VTLPEPEEGDKGEEETPDKEGSLVEGLDGEAEATAAIESTA